MENDKESEHEAELCKRNQQETRMFYLPIYNQKWMEFILYESIWNQHTDTVSSLCASRDTQAIGNNFIIYFHYLRATNTYTLPLCLY